MASGDTKTEAMLNVLGNGGSGDEFRGCCNTKTQSYILDAIDRINAIQPGGSSDFNDLENRPQLNSVAMTGNTNITNFVGTDGTAAGAQGLVPAPATTDADKFLKSDGTWATAGGGGGPTVVQTIGNSTTDVMSQNAVSSLIYADPTSQSKIWISSDNRRADAQNDSICIGPSAYCSSNGSISIGYATWPGNGVQNVVIGYGSQNNNFSYQTWGNILIGTEARLSGSNAIIGSLALGAYSGGNVTASGMVDFGSSNINAGYNSTNYRLLTGVHDAQNAHDAVTLGQLNALIAQLQNLGLSVSLQGASNNANQNSGSSEDPGTSAEPEPEPGGGSAQAPTYPYYEGTHVFYLYNGQEVYYDETSPVQDLYYRDGTLAMTEADWCQDEGQGTVYYCGGGGDMEPVEPDEPIAPEEPTEEPVEG